MKAFIRKNKDNSTTKVFRVKCTGKKGISEKSKYFVHQKITAKKKRAVPEKGTAHTFSGQTLRQKKYGFQGSRKKCMSSKKKVLKKKEFILFGAKHSANKSMGSKKNMSSKKKELILFRAKHCARKSQAPKIRVPKKKELILTFFEPHIVPKKV